CERQLGFRAFPHDTRQALTQSLVDGVEHGSRCWIALSEGLPHTYGLATLPWKCKCERHAACAASCVLKIAERQLYCLQPVAPETRFAAACQACFGPPRCSFLASLRCLRKAGHSWGPWKKRSSRPGTPRCNRSTLRGGRIFVCRADNLVD